MEGVRRYSNQVGGGMVVKRKITLSTECHERRKKKSRGAMRVHEMYYMKTVRMGHEVATKAK